ncbi:DNA-binding XRE family transcriptional regulator [Amycolatopsis bartoniae]|nr:helix-turn-helix transcriptional regulator [Amycolatopsis bartoniae]MBB2934689.1 DNA-binding XRE family transcriptional regulator [Amycolatopsis bartoniae]TVT09343.1 helix-turn-helix domain-containing protein [Amycolatopsis bartoniae]
MGTPLGNFLRTMRDSVQPESLGLPEHGRRRSPGLRRQDLAARAGISVEYLTRLEQGRDRNPSVEVLRALGDALCLDPAQRNHLRYLFKISRGGCVTHPQSGPPRRDVRPPVLRTLRLLEPGIAVVTNRVGDILARTSGFETVTSGTGLLDGDEPNLTRYVFTDPRAGEFFADWDDVADEQVFDLWLGSTLDSAYWLSGELAQVPEFTRRLHRHVVPRRGPLRLNHPGGPELRLLRETLELSSDGQSVVVFLPADERTAQAVEALRRPGGSLRAIS